MAERGGVVHTAVRFWCGSARSNLRVGAVVKRAVAFLLALCCGYAGDTVSKQKQTTVRVVLLVLRCERQL